MNTTASLAKDFLSQPSIAIVGISSKGQSVANGVYKKLKSGPRKVFAVGRNTPTFDGDQCYSSLAALPAKVDGVFVAVDAKETENIVNDCITQHIPRVWFHNMGGITTSSGSVSAQAVQKCKENNISVIAGACPMMFCERADFGHKCIKWFLGVTGKLASTK